MAQQDIITGYTCDTKQNFLLDSGAVFKNFVVGTDTAKTAQAAGKLLGATRGGSSFTATPEIRMREVDGLRGTPKGGISIDSWAVTLVANFIEWTPETLKAALGAAEISDDEEGYKLIRGRNMPNDEDYYDNITWVGTISGSDEPVIIQIYNALSTSGISASFADKSEAVLPVTFQATYDACGAQPTDPNFAPFAIYFPERRPATPITPPAPTPPIEGDDEDDETGDN